MSSERVSWPQRALLARQDLAAAEDAADRLRRAHLRAVHATWGVAAGFDVIAARFGEAVAVGPGVAYDCHGRAILSSRTVVLRTPAPPGDGVWWLDLLVAYEPDLGARDSGGCSAREERPRWRWQWAGRASSAGAPPPPGPLRNGEELPLARLRVAPGQGAVDPDLSWRPAVRPLANPRAGSGRLAPGAPAAGSDLAWSVRVDTSAGRFSGRPHYQAWLTESPPRLAPLGPFLSVSDEQRDSFVLTVRTAEAEGTHLRGTPPVTTLPVGVAWIGVERAPRCAPRPKPGQVAGPPLAAATFAMTFDLPDDD